MVSKTIFFVLYTKYRVLTIEHEIATSYFISIRYSCLTLKWDNTNAVQSNLYFFTEITQNVNRGYRGYGQGSPV